MTIEEKYTSVEESYSCKQGDVWYEEGSYPLISIADDGEEAGVWLEVI